MKIVTRKLIDEPYLTRAKDTESLGYLRECSECGDQWRTVEIQLMSDSRADLCWEHPDAGSYSINTKNATYLQNSRYRSSDGANRAQSMGGVYRRRQCAECEVRWTTVEVDIKGRVVDDVCKCPRCGSKSKIVEVIV